MKFGVRDLAIMPLNSPEFCENRCSEICISLQGINDILPVISTLLIRFEIKSAHDLSVKSYLVIVMFVKTLHRGE